jgi:NAD(P)H-hydrate epimerase
MRVTLTRMDEPLALTRDQSRRVDSIAIERYGIPGIVLMENAGHGVVDVLLEIDPAPRVAVLCGKGNNAGDGFVIARHLEIRGVDVRVLLLGAPAELTGDARQNFDVLTRCDVPIFDLSIDCSAARLEQHTGGATWLIDALLGTGAKGEPREPMRTAILWMNAQPARRLAVDVPSGLDCDTGEPSGAAVRADVTCTFVAKKVGFVRPEATPFVGQLHVVSIGVPTRLIREVAEAREIR